MYNGKLMIKCTKPGSAKIKVSAIAGGTKPGTGVVMHSDYGSVKKLQVNMKNIRKKMGVTPGEKRYIINELGVGYRMLAEDEIAADSFL